MGRLTYKYWADETPGNLTDNPYEAFTYDGVGNQLTHRLPDNSLHTFTYDGMDRLDTASYAGEFSYEFDYTLTGMRDLITEQRNSVTTWTSDYAYDAQDRVTSVTTPNGTVSYTYDPNGNRASMTTPSGTTSYQYNGNDQLTQVTAPMGQTNLTYTNVGLPDTLTYPNGVVKEYGYDDRDRLTSLTYQDGMTTLASYNYTLDTVGNRTRVDELGGDYTTWGYDNQYRLTNETIHDGGSTISSSYTYDAVGNRTSQTVNGQATTYSYNALDQMTQSVTGGVTTTYAYDGRGNLATTTTGSDVTTYSWDALDRLTTVDMPVGADSAYTYDPNGYRVLQTLGSDTTHYLWDEFSAYGDVIRETNGTGTELANYTLANQQLISQVRGGVANYYVQDGQGSTRALTNAAGSITDTYDYLAYGQLYNQTGTTTNPYLYTGQQFDSATGLYDLRARYYDPNVGRFLSRDTYPINYQNPIELNRYGYTANNPINGYDPTGYLLFENGTIEKEDTVVGVPILTLLGQAVKDALDLLIFLLAVSYPDTYPDTNHGQDDHNNREGDNNRGNHGEGDESQNGNGQNNQQEGGEGQNGNGREGQDSGPCSALNPLACVDTGSSETQTGPEAETGTSDPPCWFCIPTGGETSTEEEECDPAVDEECQDDESTSIVYRVQTPSWVADQSRSRERIKIGPNGEMVVEGRDMLFITFDDYERAFYYKVHNRPVGSYIISFEVNADFVKAVRAAAVSQRQASQFPGAPQISDPKASRGNSFGLPELWIDMLIANSRPGTGKIEY